MEDWQKDWMKTWETMTQGISQLFEEIGREMSEAADALIDFTDEIADGLERSITPGLEQFDQQLSEWLDPVLEVFVGLETTLDHAVEPVTHTVEPMLNQHPVCIGCRHYHGQAYNGVMFVCAMHPYGMVDGEEDCPDKETITWSLPSARNPNDLDDMDERF